MGRYISPARFGIEWEYEGPLFFYSVGGSSGGNVRQLADCSRRTDLVHYFNFAEYCAFGRFYWGSMDDYFYSVGCRPDLDLEPAPPDTTFCLAD